jgi:hypothetical protein
VPKVAASNAPAAVKSQFDAFKKEFDTLKAKFGVTDPDTTTGGAGGRGGRGGGRGGGGGNPNDVVGRAGAIKGSIMGIWESPSDAMVKQYTDVKAALPAALAEANAFLAKARTMSQTLQRSGVTLLVPAR